MKLDKKIVVLCTSRIYDPQVHGYIEKLNEALVAQNCALLIFTINSDLYWDDSRISAEMTVFDIIPYELADVIIVMDEKIKSKVIAGKIIERAKQSKKPVITVDGHYDDTLHVNFDYATGFEKAVRHVLSQRKIERPHMMAGIKDNPFSDERIEVFKKVISEYGYTFNESMLSYGDFWAGPAIRETEKLIASGIVPDAIICANDIMAINVCDVLMQHGYSIPDDVLVSGFDGYDEVFITTPKITTVSCTTPELADTTAELVAKLVAPGYDPGLVSDVAVVPTLYTNESTGCEMQTGYDRFMLNRFNNMFYRHHDVTRIMHEVATRMQLSKDPDEMVAHIADLIVNDEKVMTGVSFVLNKSVFDKDNYFFDNPSDKVDLSDYTIVFDAAISRKLIDNGGRGKMLLPGNEKFADKLGSGYPMIFNAIDYMDAPVGYICYNFHDFDITKYSRTANLTNTISMGVGGYATLKYQQNLAEKMNEMYKRDSLTGLYNRMGFNDILEQLKSDKSLRGKKVTVIMSDLDGLKYINDNFGHAEGDKAIFMTAQALKQACPEDAVCVRFGGDELFAVIIGDCVIDEIIADVEAHLENYNRISGKEYKVLVSCGGAVSVFDVNFDIRKALRIADENMYAIKNEHHEDVQGKA